MTKQIFEESNYRFSDPIRYFKANDPYFFEVDNIPLKQLQENCLWLKDQVRKNSGAITSVKRGDIDELRPYASGGDRVVKVLPGRYTARINDASTKRPLAYLAQLLGQGLGEVDGWAAATPDAVNDPIFKDGEGNQRLEAALNRFQSLLSTNALGMTGLEERVFTRPVVNSDFPVDLDGVDLTASGKAYAGPSENIPGGGAYLNPAVVTQALLWAKSLDASVSRIALPSFEFTSASTGFSKFPRTESFFIKAWRGISRNSIVDVPDELSIEVPSFDDTDFSYIDSEGNETQVDGVQSRIDMVFIYSKPIDASSVDILKASGRETITQPTLGIVRGAGIKANFEETNNPSYDYLDTQGDQHSILAAPGDTTNTDMGFTSASGNDIAYSVRGSFPSPDDILNIAPVISEKLEDNAIELVGQSILPVAYVWVQKDSQVVLDTDVIDIRPLFRTAELAYNERAGITAAFPQLSLANPAVGKSQMDYELQRVYDNLAGRVDNVAAGLEDPSDSFNTLATGYVFGGYFFGPESALFDYYQNELGLVNNPNGIQTIKNTIRSTYNFGQLQAGFEIPDRPDWDLAEWCRIQNIDSKGEYVNDYINTFLSQRRTVASDASIVGGNMLGQVRSDGRTPSGDFPERNRKFLNDQRVGGNPYSNASFHYISKTINFTRPAWLADYHVDMEFVNCVAQNWAGDNAQDQGTITYFGHWVEKRQTSFTIYIAFCGSNPSSNQLPKLAAPHTNTNGVTVNGRGLSKFSSFAVPVRPLLYSNTSPVLNGQNLGYVGNPRLGVCTYPTVSWKITGIPNNAINYHYTSLNSPGPIITLRDS